MSFSGQEDRDRGLIDQLGPYGAGVGQGSAADTLSRILEAVRNNLGMEVSFISQFSKGHRVFLYVDSSPGIHIIRKHAPASSKAPLFDPSVRSLPVAQTQTVKTHASVPIRSDNNQIIGTLCCYSCNRKDELDEPDIRFLASIADLVAQVLQQEQRLLDDQRRQRDYIRNIVTSDELRMVWQPIIDLETRKLVGLESLARFQTDPYKPPNEWFDDAVAVGIGTEVEKNAFAKGMAIRRYLPESIYVSCNLSGTTFLEPEFQEFLQQQDLTQVVLEITEHDAISDYDQLATTLATFRSQGLRLAIDDFGAGYAGFRHIVELNPDTIKLDVSLARNIDQNLTIQSVVRALVGFARDQKLNLLAEGVETQEELSMLSSLGVERAQGYFFHRPMHLPVLLEFLQSMDCAS